MGIAPYRQFARDFIVSRRGKAFLQRSLLLAALGVTTCLSVNYANAQATTTTHFTCVGPIIAICNTTSTEGGANTGNIASRDIASQIESDIEKIREQRAKKKLHPIITTKAPPPPPEPNIDVAAWADGNYSRSIQTGTFNGANIGSDTRTGGGIGGVDFTIKLPTDDYVVVGFFGGENKTYLTVPTGATGTTIAPTAGAYLVYLKGNFSADLTYSDAWMKNSGTDVTTVSTFVVGATTVTATSTATALSTVLASDNVEGNVRYKYILENNWWVEPYTGLAFIDNVESAGLQDMKTVKVQGGAKAGTSFMWGDVTVLPTFTGVIYSDVSVTGGFVPGGPPTETDQGQVWGKGVARLTFDWTKNFETSIEGAVYGTRGLENIIAYSGLLELKYKF